MLNWNEIIQKYIIKHSNRIAKTTQPLHDHFGVGYFTYHKINNAGQYTVLVDRPDWAEHYVEEKYFQQDPYLRHPKNYSTGFSLYGNHGSNEYKKTVVKAGTELFNMDLGAILIQKGEDGVEFFGFAANTASSCLDKIYLNRQSLLIKFAAYFKKELGDILCKMQDEAGYLIDLKGEDFHTQEFIQPDLTSHELFLEEIGCKAELDISRKLSKREKECMRFLLEGKSSKETAACLNLSPRTVEFYFVNIKNKLTCWNKSDLAKVAKELADLSLL